MLALREPPSHSQAVGGVRMTALAWVFVTVGAVLVAVAASMLHLSAGLAVLGVYLVLVGLFGIDIDRT